MNIEKENRMDQGKQEWKIPSLYIIPFKNTKDGDATFQEEDFGGTINEISQ